MKGMEKLFVKLLSTCTIKYFLKSSDKFTYVYFFFRLLGTFIIKLLENCMMQKWYWL